MNQRFYTCWNIARLSVTQEIIVVWSHILFSSCAWECVLLWDNRLIPFLSPCLSEEQQARKAVESGEQARAFPCVAVLTETEGLDNGMILSLRIPREWQKAERAHASLSSGWPTKPCSRISQECLFFSAGDRKKYDLLLFSLTNSSGEDDSQDQGRSLCDVSSCLPAVFSHPAAK